MCKYKIQLSLKNREQLRKFGPPRVCFLGETEDRTLLAMKASWMQLENREYKYLEGEKEKLKTVASKTWLRFANMNL